MKVIREVGDTTRAPAAYDLAEVYLTQDYKEMTKYITQQMFNLIAQVIHNFHLFHHNFHQQHFKQIVVTVIQGHQVLLVHKYSIMVKSITATHIITIIIMVPTQRLLIKAVIKMSQHGKLIFLVTKMRIKRTTKIWSLRAIQLGFKLNCMPFV